jgi:hypothetical protein
MVFPFYQLVIERKIEQLALFFQFFLTFADWTSNIFSKADNCKLAFYILSFKVKTYFTTTKNNPHK